MGCCLEIKNLILVVPLVQQLGMLLIGIGCWNWQWPSLGLACHGEAPAGVHQGMMSLPPTECLECGWERLRSVFNISEPSQFYFFGGHAQRMWRTRRLFLCYFQNQVVCHMIFLMFGSSKLLNSVCFERSKTGVSPCGQVLGQGRENVDDKCAHHGQCDCL